MNARLRPQFETLLLTERARILSLLAAIDNPSATAAKSPGEEGEAGAFGAGDPSDAALPGARKPFARRGSRSPCSDGAVSNVAIAH